MVSVKLKKKILSLGVSVAFGLGAIFSAVPAPAAEAFSLGDAIGIGIGVASMAAQKEQVVRQLEYYDNDDNGREELYQQFRVNQGVNEDYELNQRLDVIMDNLSQAVAQVDPSINERPYKHFINQDSSINASCAMGHVMTVNTGTFANIPSDDEIAAIVGHEMGHGQKNHVYKSNVAAMDKTIIANAAVALEGGTFLGQLVGNVLLNQSIVHGNKDYEWEADNLAFDYMQHTEYNLGACAAVMQRFLELMGSQKQSGLEMLLNPSDHPNTEARRDNYAKKLYEYSNKHVKAEKGAVKVNDKEFVVVAPAAGMSGEERSFFVLGNLAAAYRNGYDKETAYVQDGTVMLGPQDIITPVDGDEAAEVLAARLNSIK